MREAVWSHDDRYITLPNGVRACYTCAGNSGTPVVLVHGAASTRLDWSATLPALAENHRVYALDLAGYGESTRDSIPYTLPYYAEYLRAFLDKMGLKRAHLVGHSLGARVCLEFARHAGERVNRLVLIAPMGFGRLSKRGKVLTTVTWLFRRFSPRRRELYPTLHVRSFEPELDPLHEVTAPALVVWGKRDRYFPSRYAQRAKEILLNAQVRLFPGAGHAPHRDQPLAFNEVLADFLP